MTWAFIDLYQWVIQQYKNEINAVPPPSQAQIAAMQATINQLQSEIKVLQQFLQNPAAIEPQWRPTTRGGRASGGRGKLGRPRGAIRVCRPGPAYFRLDHQLPAHAGDPDRRVGVRPASAPLVGRRHRRRRPCPLPPTPWATPGSHTSPLRQSALGNPPAVDRRRPGGGRGRLRHACREAIETARRPQRSLPRRKAALLCLLGPAQTGGEIAGKMAAI